MASQWWFVTNTIIVVVVEVKIVVFSAIGQFWLAGLKKAITTAEPAYSRAEGNVTFCLLQQKSITKEVLNTVEPAYNRLQGNKECCQLHNKSITRGV